ncbi:MAG: hypothetical protein QME14_03730 [Methanobacteriaceae archaeon]|nr:hypothetical protein [Methanobacteriaceae archaeon]
MQLHADLYDISRDAMQSWIDEVLKLVELEEGASNYLNTYSGGMILVKRL